MTARTTLIKTRTRTPTLLSVGVQLCQLLCTGRPPARAPPVASYGHPQALRVAWLGVRVAVGAAHVEHIAVVAAALDARVGGESLRKPCRLTVV